MTIINIISASSVPRAAIIHTRLLHDVYRRATSLLATNARSRSASEKALRELTGFVVSEIRYHHQSEDRLVWPILRSANPGAAATLNRLGGGHSQVDCSLELLNQVAIRPGGDADALAHAAVAVRDVVHHHLANEEEDVLPMLAAHVSDARWGTLANRIMAGAPTDYTYLMVGLLDEVGPAKRVNQVLAGLPQTTLVSLPELRARAQDTLAGLRVA
jgi:hypothetical protein